MRRLLHIRFGASADALVVEGGDPRARGGRLRHRVEDHSGSYGVDDLGAVRPALGDRAKEQRGLDDLEVVVAHRDPGPGLERRVLAGPGTDEDGRRRLVLVEAAAAD